MKNALLACLSAAVLLSFGTMQPQAAPPTKVVPIVVGDDDPNVAPAVTIVAPDKPVKRGHQIVFGVSDVPKPKNLATYTYVWIVQPAVDDLFAWPDNTKATFGTGTASEPKHYDITLVANFVFTNDDGKSPTIKTTMQTVGVDVTDSGPDPVPTPVNPVVPPRPKPVPQPIPNPYPNPNALPGFLFK